MSYDRPHVNANRRSLKRTRELRQKKRHAETRKSGNEKLKWLTPWLKPLPIPGIVRSLRGAGPPRIPDLPDDQSTTRCLGIQAEEAFGRQGSREKAVDEAKVVPDSAFAETGTVFCPCTRGIWR
mmetsp:Transcript_33729/g.55471  ORF Transcript_33729/g.55471 Transcript_33729/m.55471 type:complete len:124 (-) Transcript_33729:1048-1419(-)